MGGTGRISNTNNKNNSDGKVQNGNLLQSQNLTNVNVNSNSNGSSTIMGIPRFQNISLVDTKITNNNSILTPVIPVKIV